MGYIERYRDPSLEGFIDACIAENHPIAETLAKKYGWPAARAPVVWPCGRRSRAIPAPHDHHTIRRRIRGELSVPEGAILLLTAARMHEQKRPLDIVRLAERVRDVEHLYFLVVGGGPVEGDMDRAIAAAGDLHIRRLAFRADVPELIIAADAGLLVSEFEGLPVFMLECLQLGRPFIGTAVGDLGTVLRETGAGLVAGKPGDLDAVEQAIRELPDARSLAVLAKTGAGSPS